MRPNPSSARPAHSLPQRRPWRALWAGALAVALSACASGISLDEPIEGPNWRLVQLAGQAVPADADPARAPQVQFDLYGRVTGSGGCNRLSGAFTRSGSQLGVSQLGATRLACADAARSQTETGFFHALQSTASYRLVGEQQLLLLDAGGRTLATLQSAR